MIILLNIAVAMFFFHLSSFIFTGKHPDLPLYKIPFRKYILLCISCKVLQDNNDIMLLLLNNSTFKWWLFVFISFIIDQSCHLLLCSFWLMSWLVNLRCSLTSGSTGVFFSSPHPAIFLVINYQREQMRDILNNDVVTFICIYNFDEQTNVVKVESVPGNSFFFYLLKLCCITNFKHSTQTLPDHFLENCLKCVHLKFFSLFFWWDCCEELWQNDSHFSPCAKWGCLEILMLLKCCSCALWWSDASFDESACSISLSWKPAWQRPWAGGMGNFTFLLCPVSEDATLSYLSVVEKAHWWGLFSCQSGWNEPVLIRRGAEAPRRTLSSLFNCRTVRLERWPGCTSLFTTATNTMGIV